MLNTSLKMILFLLICLSLISCEGDGGESVDKYVEGLGKEFSKGDWNALKKSLIQSGYYSDISNKVLFLRTFQSYCKGDSEKLGMELGILEGRLKNNNGDNEIVWFGKPKEIVYPHDGDGEDEDNFLIREVLPKYKSPSKNMMELTNVFWDWLEKNENIDPTLCCYPKGNCFYSLTNEPPLMDKTVNTQSQFEGKSRKQNTTVPPPAINLKKKLTEATGTVSIGNIENDKKTNDDNSNQDAVESNLINNKYKNKKKKYYIQFGAYKDKDKAKKEVGKINDIVMQNQKLINFLPKFNSKDEITWLDIRSSHQLPYVIKLYWKPSDLEVAKDFEKEYVKTRPGACKNKADCININQFVDSPSSPH